jgi:hypothetical protein
MILGFSDYARSGTLSCDRAFSGSAPLANLQTRRLGQRGRSTVAAETLFRLTVDLGQPRPIGLVGLLSPDPLLMPEDAPFPVVVPTARVEISNVSAAGAEAWSGYTLGVRHALAIPAAGNVRILPIARWVSFVFRSGANNWSAGRVWVSPVWWPQDGIDTNWSTGQIDSGTNRPLRGGANTPRPGVILDTLSGTFGSMPLADALGPSNPEGTHDLKSTLRVTGNTGEVLIVPRGLGRVSPAGWVEQNSRMVDQLAVYGRITSDLADAIQHTDADNYSASLTVVEER